MLFVFFKGIFTPISPKWSVLLLFQHAGVHHRRAVLCFLAQLDVDELQLFFSLLLKPLFALGHGTDSSCEKFKDGLQVFDLVEFSRTIGDLSWKKIYGFLHVVKDILKAFDEIHIRPFLKLLMEIVVRILESCMLNIAGANHFNPLLVGHISSCDLKSQEKESIAHNSVRVCKCDLLCWIILLQFSLRLWCLARWICDQNYFCVFLELHYIQW